MTKEKNISAFNFDIVNQGQYVYTSKDHVSALIATLRQTKAIYYLLKKYVGTHARIIDAGCGDGTYSLELFKLMRPIRLLGFDPAEKAIKLATRNAKSIGNEQLQFTTLSIYDLAKHIKPGEFDVVVLRGVLHHLYKPKEAITEISKVANCVVVLEPNGFNPILKLIEKLSPYHVAHEEQSYWPPTLNSWFENENFTITEQHFVCIVPYFCPPWMARILRKIEPFFEKLPLVHLFYTGTNVFIAHKKNSAHQL